MTGGISDQLAPGDAVERTTRATYTEWARRSLDVAQRVAEEQTDPAVWPELPAERATVTPCVWAPQPADPSGGSVERALRAGWLVTTHRDGEPAAVAGALSGLAVAVKDIIDVAGLPLRNGTPGALWREPTASAGAWTRLATAGAHCVGKAATHEMAWGVTTPQIAHPLHPDRIAGGSSGGSAACVAAHASQGALGTDTGGSIRIPAALCGVVGFRPTTGTVDMAGVTPLAPEQDVVGPMAADVGTGTAMLEVLLDRTLGTELRPEEAMRGLRIGVLQQAGRLDPAIEEAYRRTLAALERAGARIVTCDTALFRQAGSISLLRMLTSSAGAHAQSVHADPAGFGGEARALLTIGENLTTQAGLIERAGVALTARTARLFTSERLDAFLTPTTACTAPPRGADTIEITGRPEPVSAALTRFTAWASVAAMPAVTVPVPGSGLPVGVQAMAPPRREDTCVRVARFIEHITVQADRPGH